MMRWNGFGRSLLFGAFAGVAFVPFAMLATPFFDWSGAVAPMGASGQPSFWAINKIPWQGMSAGNIPPPLATLKLGRSYIFQLENPSQYHHPIHLHGVVFTVLNRDFVS